MSAEAHPFTPQPPPASIKTRQGGLHDVLGAVEEPKQSLTRPQGGS